jgi:hypothetical protein
MQTKIKFAKMKNALFLITLFIVSNNGFAQCGLQLPAKYPLGAGLNGIEDYTKDRVFNDVFKANRGFSANVNQPWSSLAPTTDADGWPLEDFGVVVMTEMDTTMGGTYKLRFEGQATLGTIASGCTIQNISYNSTTNSTTADIVYPAVLPGIGQLMLKFTNTQFATGVAGVKNIKLMKPGTTFTSPNFSAQFLEHISRFQCLRFMDWRHTNANSDSLWTNRKLITSPTQTGSSGIAWEYCIELANTANKDMWINVPHKADSLYIAGLAQLIDSTLNPNLNVYIEHSNEVWNFSFIQAGYNRDRAVAEVTGNPNSQLSYDGNTNQYTLAQRRHGLRTKQISDIFKSVMGASELNNRFRVMLGTQLFGFYSSMQGLDFINNVYGNPSDYLYGVAIAPYFSPSAVDTGNTATQQQILDAMQQDIDSTIFGEANNQVELYAARTNYFGLKLFCYEGGPDTYGANNIAEKRNAMRSTEMKDMCYNFLKQWYTYSADGLFNWFTVGAGSWNTQYGTWSLTENYEYSFKLQAMDSLLSSPVSFPAAGNQIPGIVEGRKVAGASAGTLAATSFTPTGWKGAEDWLILVPKDSAGIYSLMVETAANSNAQKVILFIDNQFIDTLNIPNNNSTTIFENSPTYILPSLDEGLHTLRVQYVVSNPDFRIKDFHFSLVNPCVTSNTIDVEPIDTFNIYPNPASTYLTIETSGNETMNVELLDMSGRLVFTTQLTDKQTIDISKLSPSVYFIKLIGSQGTAVKRWVKE